MLTVKFMSLTGKFQTLHTAEFTTRDIALCAVEAHAKAGGFSNVKIVNDADGWRFTARSAGGRGGRNVAFMDFDYTE